MRIHWQAAFCAAVLWSGGAHAQSNPFDKFDSFNCSAERAATLAVETDRALSQAEILLPELAESDKVFFDAEQAALQKGVLSGKPDWERNSYVTSLPKYWRWNLSNMADQVRSAGAFASKQGTGGMGKLVQQSAIIMALLHNFSSSWYRWYLREGVTAVGAEPAMRIRDNLDDQIANWSMFTQGCGRAISR
ncbi:hypothetical protein GS397_07170 [Sphingobium yanoikuyae]|uniref:Uncharacterized protein n=1 Tax=Sphingobium yanoikuyae TaxID=13690 RepID=A0A6P1GEP8_SPHYA|nr:hypothetical protein [Sphingobium yanoikuyae]QHD66850.1 hypothetical protein GS397_07170 [Sphingobium yanoikuyae]